MKKKINKILCALLITAIGATFTACDLYPSNDSTPGNSATGEFIPGNGGSTTVNILVADKSLQEEYAEETLSQVINRTKKGVVGISIQTSNTTLNGSGVIIGNSDDGVYTYIATSHSLIAGASSVTVYNYEKQDTFSATPVGTDPVTDVCVMRINANLAPNVFYADSSTVEAGEEIVALANVMGQQSIIASKGIISATQYEQNGGEGNINELLLIDANTAYGSVGGGVFSANGGYLLGMIRSGSTTGLPPYVVPSSILQSVCSEIIEKGYVEGRYKLGITVSDNKSGWGITENVSVTALSTDGCIYANGLGLKVGDTILSVVYDKTNYNVNRTEELYSYLYEIDFKIGDLVTFNIERNGTQSQVTIKITQYDYFSFN